MESFTELFPCKKGLKTFFGKIILFLVLFSLFAAISSATMISKKHETMELGKTTRVSIRINYTELTSSQISTVVPASHEPADIRGFDKDGELTCMYRETFGKEIICDPRKGKDSHYVTIQYTTPSVSEQKQDYLTFTHQYRVLVPTKEYELEIILPEGYGTVGKEETTSFLPENAKTGSEGRRIYLLWNEKNISLGDALSYEVNYQELNVFQNIFPSYFAMFGALTVIIFAIAVSLYVKRKKKGEETIAAVLPVLKKDEKDVLMYMIKKEGECGQKELVENLKYSKAKISRLVKDLAERNLVEKIKEGRTNRLVLKKEIGDIKG